MVHEARTMDSTCIMGGRCESRMGRDGLTVASRLEHLGCGDPAAASSSAGGEQGAGWRVAPLLGGFCPPVRLPFIILDVEPSAHLVCTGGADSWMYVMTRERRPDPGVVEALLAKLAASGVDVSKLMPMEHTGTS